MCKGPGGSLPLEAVPDAQESPQESMVSTPNEDFKVDQKTQVTRVNIHILNEDVIYTLNHYCANILYPKRRLRYQKRQYIKL